MFFAIRMHINLLSGGPSLRITLRAVRAVWLLLALVVAVGCSRTPAPTSLASSSSSPAASPTASPQIIPLPIAGLAATLEDEISDLPRGQMAWTTFWKLCWQAYPGATGYELETMTGEGAARKLRRQAETCFRIEVAKGRNEKAKGLFNRDLMLASISGQLSYRVRAVLDGNRVSAWSPLMEAGRPGSGAIATPDLPKKSAPRTR